MEVVLRAELIAMLVVACVDFEGKMLYLSDHQESTGSKELAESC